MELEGKEAEVISRGHVVEGMRLIRQRTGCSLMDAKQAVSRWQAKVTVSHLAEARDMAEQLGDSVTYELVSMVMTRLEGKYINS
jgi:ribosomal protein L7/L12